MSKQSNALLHGVYSQDMVLPGERVEDFEALLDGIRADVAPQGTIEEGVVVDLVLLHWRKRRINSLLQLEFANARLAGEGEQAPHNRRCPVV